MKSRHLFLASVLLSLSYSASASQLSCDDLKAKIEKRLESKNVKTYTLQVVAKDTPTKNRVVGSCEAGSKKIIYQKTSAKLAAD